MSYNTIDDIRKSWGAGWADASDEEVLEAYSRTARVPLATVADKLGFDPGRGSLTGERFSASTDNYQAGLYETAGAAARGLGLSGVSDWATERANSNRTRADVASARAKGLGGVDSYKDVDSVGSGLNYLGGLAVQSAPYMAEAVVGGVAGRAISGTSKALQAAHESLAAAKASGSVAEIANATEKVARATRAAELAGTAGATAASYPSAVGDILGNQREQNGTTDDAYAAAAAVPYALLNGALGVEGVLGKGKLNPLRDGVLDNAQTLGRTQRMLAAGAKVGAGEAVSETGQEVINQGGRVMVDPSASMTSPEALERYGESAVGGGALGFVFGAAGNRGRKSGQVQQADLLNDTPEQEQQTPLQLGFSGYDTGVGELVTMPDGTTMTRQEYEDRRSGKYVPAVQGQRGLSVPVQDATDVNSENQYGFGHDMLALPAPAAKTTSEQERPGVLNVTPAGTVAPMSQLSGQQPDMFGGQDTFGETGTLPQRDDTLGRPLPVQSVAQPDGQTSDILDANPTAYAPTAVNPLTEPNSYGVAAYPAEEKQRGNAPAGQKTEETRGAVASNIRSQIAQRVGHEGDMTVATSLALHLAQTEGDVNALRMVVEEAKQKQQKQLDSLEKKVSHGSDQLTPDEYIKQRDVIERRMLTVMAAEDYVNRISGQSTSAQADEGALKAQPGVEVGKRPGPARGLRSRNFNETVGVHIADTDATVQASREKTTATERQAILDGILADNKVKNKIPAFTSALKRAGYTLIAPTKTELATISKHGDVRKDFRKGPVLDRESVVSPKVEETPAPKKVEPAPVAKEPENDRTTSESLDGIAKSLVRSGGDERVGSESAPVADRTGTGAQRATTARAATESAGRGEQSAPADAPRKRNRTLSLERMAEVNEDIAALNDALQIYNEPAKSDSPSDIRTQASRAKNSADYIYGEANDPANHPLVREHAAKLLEDIDLNDVTDAEERKSGVNGKVGDDHKSGKTTITLFDSETGETYERRFSEGGYVAPDKQMSQEELGSLLDEVFGDSASRDSVTVLDSASDLPGVEVPPGATPAGAVVNGKIYLFRDGISSRLEAVKTIFHEAFHFGLRKQVKPEEYNRVMNNLYAMDPEVRSLANTWMKSADGKAVRRGMVERGEFFGPGMDAYRAQAVDEALADIAERLKTESGMGSAPMNALVRTLAKWMARVAELFGEPGKRLADAIRKMSYNNTEKFVQDVLDAALAGKTEAQTNPYGKNYNTLAGKDVTIQIPMAEGGTASMTLDAKSVLNDIDRRLEALEMVRRCLA